MEIKFCETLVKVPQILTKFHFENFVIILRSKIICPKYIGI